MDFLGKIKSLAFAANRIPDRPFHNPVTIRYSICIVGRLRNYKLGKMWKEDVMTRLKIRPGHAHEGYEVRLSHCSWYPTQNIQS
jgi:hypothetical protein